MLCIVTFMHGILGLGHLHGCGMRANLLHTAQGQVCTRYACCTGVYVVLFAVATVTMLPHPCWSWLPVTCGQWWHRLILQISNGGIL